MKSKKLNILNEKEAVRFLSLFAFIAFYVFCFYVFIFRGLGAYFIFVLRPLVLLWFAASRINDPSNPITYRLLLPQSAPVVEGARGRIRAEVDYSDDPYMLKIKADGKTFLSRHGLVMTHPFCHLVAHPVLL